MLTYDLKVGYSCNNACKHCVIDDSKDRLLQENIEINLTTEECIEQIQSAALKGISNIVLTGGEVTIRSDFPQLIKKCNEYNLNITIQTNGRRLSNNIIYNTVKDIKNIRFIVALHGDNEKTHDLITQKNGSFKETCEGIKKICDLKKLLVLKIVISKINMKQLSGIVELASELGVKYFCFAFPHGQGSARKNFSEIIPKYSELKPNLENLIKVAKSKQVNIEFEAVPFCIIPNNMRLVGELKYYTGDTLCTQVKEDTFQWSMVRKSIKRKGKQCSQCDMDQFCEGVWSEYIEEFGADELIPISFGIDREKILYEIKSYLCKI